MHLLTMLIIHKKNKLMVKHHLMMLHVVKKKIFIDVEQERYRRGVVATKQRISREMGGGSENSKGEKGCHNSKTRESIREMGGRKGEVMVANKIMC